MALPTITIGIPAYNEEENIGYLLRSILRQKQTNFRLKKIIIVSDGTDKTTEVARTYAKKYPFIQVVGFSERLGKAVALNKIYDLSDTDFLMQFDADVVLDRDTEIELMVSEMLKDKNVDLVGGRFIPVKQDTLMGKFSTNSYLMIEDAFLRLNGGCNIFALVGLASLIRRKLYKSFTYPKSVISDQNYLFATATLKGKSKFKLAKDTRIFLRTVSTFMDWRLLGARSVVEDKASVAHFFGKKILKEYSMPKEIYLMSILKYLLKDPINTIGAVLMNLYIRLFPYKKAILGEGVWQPAYTSKKGIARSQI